MRCQNAVTKRKRDAKLSDDVTVDDVCNLQVSYMSSHFRSCQEAGR